MNFDVIDTHVHLYPDKISEKVTVALGAKFGNPPAFIASVASCAAFAEKSGISLSLNLPVATTPDQVGPINRWAREIRGPRVLSLAALHPDSENRAAIIGGLAADGFRGIKFHPEYQLFRFNDSKMDEVWNAMSETGLVAYLHAGGERVFEPPFRSSPREVAELARRFPRLKIAAAHLGGFRMWDETERELCGADVYLDLSHALLWMPDEQLMRIVRKHGIERILFGSDAPWQDPRDVLAAFLRLPFSDEERTLVLAGNARRLFGFEGKEAKRKGM